MTVADKGTEVMDELLELLQHAGYEVVSVGQRYRVTDPNGGDPAFVPKRLPKGGRISNILAGLRAIGFDPDQAKKARDAARQRRVDAAKIASERALAAAQARADDARIAAELTADLAEGASLQPATITPALEPTRVAGPPRWEVFDMTPTFAEELLRANHFFDEKADHAGKCQRRFRPWLAQQYADAMLAGEWTLTHQGVAFDVTGEMFDGQHRLVAIVLAGKTKPDITVPMTVAYDQPIGAVTKVDGGLKRSLSDQLLMAGETGVLHLGAALRLIYLFDSVPYTGPEAWRRRNGPQLSSDMAAHILEREPEVRDAVKQGVALKALCLASAAGAAIHLIKREWPEPMVDAFVDQVRTGYGLQPGAAVTALRDALESKLRNKKDKDATEQMALWIKAWNIHVRRESRVKLYWKVGERFPSVLDRNLHEPDSLAAEMKRDLVDA